MLGIGILLAMVLLVFSGATLTGFVVAFLDADAAAIQVFGILTIIYATLAIFLFLVASSKPVQFKRAEIFIGAIAMWCLMVVAAMPPFLVLENAHPAAALFEAASAVTALGSSLVPANMMSGAMIFFRASVAWLGGLLSLMLAVYVLGRYAVGGTPNRDLRFVLRGASRGDPKLVGTFVNILAPYAGVTFICMVMLMLLQVEPSRALLASLAALSSNGFLGWQSLDSIFSNRLGELVFMVFMVLGASSIIWLRCLFTGQIGQTRQQNETFTYFLVAVALVVFGNVVALGDFPIQRVQDDLLNRSFDIISTLTTTGIVHRPQQGIANSPILLIGLALVGGTAYSTAGGLKLFRISAMFRHSKNEVLRLIHPNQIVPGSVDSDERVFANIKAIWSAFFTALLLVLAGAAAFAALGHGLTSSLSLSVGAFASVGSMVSANLFSVAGGGVPILSLFVISFLSLVGKIELLLVLAAFSNNRW